MPLKSEALGNPGLVISRGSRRKLRQSSQEKELSEHRARSLLRSHFKKRTKFVLPSGWASSFSMCLSNRGPTNSIACFFWRGEHSEAFKHDGVIKSGHFLWLWDISSPDFRCILQNLWAAEASWYIISLSNATTFMPFMSMEAFIDCLYFQHLFWHF